MTNNQPPTTNNYLRLIHWKLTEVEAYIFQLQQAGFTVDAEPFKGPASLRKMRENPPAAVIIDLSRLPSAGREVGVAIRFYKDTCMVPLIFVSGEAEKVARVRDILPDAVYTQWVYILDTLQHTAAHPPVQAARTTSLFDSYKGTPLAKKLGIKPGASVALVDAPDDIAQILQDLPEGVILTPWITPESSVVLWFNRSRQEYEKCLPEVAASLAMRSLWVIWPKKSSNINSDLNQVTVRKAGLSAGLVDYKICSIDDTWSGLCFRRRKNKQDTQQG